LNDWEARLASEGLAPLDQHRATSKRSASLRPWRHAAEHAEAVERWQAWAIIVLNQHEFRSDRQRAIWSLYAAGKTYSQIQAQLGGSRRSVSWAIAAVESAAPPKPCANPWRQDLRGHEQTKDPRIAWYAARRRRRAALKQSKKPEEEDMPPNPIHHFSRVLFVGHDVEWPGQRPTDRLLNANGRFVNGGIEFYSMVIKGSPDQVKEFPRAIWVSGPRIKQADREQEAVT
jgi:hypothetical protein